MIKACGFLLGQFGDLVIQTVACRAFKEQYPDSHLTFAIAKKYNAILPLFFHNRYIDDIHIFDGYDDWPNQTDKEYLDFKKFDVVYNGMAGHTRPNWYNYYHYAQEACLRQGLNPPSDISYYLEPWFEPYSEYKNVVTLSLFPSKGEQLDKTMPITECENLCLALRKMGYRPIQLGGKFEVKLQNAESPDFSFLEAAKMLRASKLHITADTAFSSVAAGYQHPCVGFYGLNYPDMTDCFSHLPVNRNAFYIKNRPVQLINHEEVIQVSKQFLT